MTSYIGAVNKGNKALKEMIIQRQKTASEMPWQKMTPDRKHTQAFQKFIRQDNTEKAERLFSDALKNRKIISNYIVRASILYPF